jgi:hypothetical protein
MKTRLELQLYDPFCGLRVFRYHDQLSILLYDFCVIIPRVAGHVESTVYGPQHARIV